ncbi:MAG TPA: hypothetical protein VD816_13980 [Ohtaekwangia sp.]|nr:hypothetical protein [Ohtaekwangia sp.]
MEATSSFLDSWDQYMYIAAAGFVGVGILILLYHEFKVFQIKDYKEKYDYVNLHEIRYFWYAIMALIIAATFFANTIATGTIQHESMRWFYVRIFISVSFAVIAYFVFFSLVRIYYPRQLEKRLKKLRNTPRISPAGNPMRKLTESEEDHHLEAGMQKDEEVHAIDYDVWIDEKTGYKKIEKYRAHQHAEECSECGYYTMKIYREDIEQAPAHEETGLLLQHFKCSYCNHREQREIIIARLSQNVN